MTDKLSSNARRDLVRLAANDENSSNSEILSQLRQYITAEEPDHNLRLYSDIISDCAGTNVKKCTELLIDIIHITNPLPRDLRKALIAVGSANIDAVSKLIEKEIENSEWPHHRRLAHCVPYLYRGNEERLARDLLAWYETDKPFCLKVIEAVPTQLHNELAQRGKENISAKDIDSEFRSELTEIQSTLEEFAAEEEIDSDDAYKEHGRISLRIATLVHDIKYPDSNIFSEVTSRNAKDYKHLYQFLSGNPNWLTELKNQNQHDLLLSLSHEMTRDEYHEWVHGRRMSRIPETERVTTKRDATKIEWLEYLDHCCEVFDFADDHERRTDLREGLLSRETFQSRVSELEVLNALRREFYNNRVEIEPNIDNSEKKPDIQICRHKKPDLWVEVTRPASGLRAEINLPYSVSTDPVTGPGRARITRKVRKDIEDYKDATGDLTLLVIRDNPSSLSPLSVENYLLGERKWKVDENGDSFVYDRGEPGYKPGELDSLDIVIRFKTTGQLHAPPYTTGQVFALNESVGDNLLYRLGHSFNAGDEVYTSQYIDELPLE